MVNLNKTMSLCQVIRHSGRGDIMSRIEKRFQVTRRDELVGRIKFNNKEYYVIPLLTTNNALSYDTEIKLVSVENTNVSITVNGSRVIDGIRVSAEYEIFTDILIVSAE